MTTTLVDWLYTDDLTNIPKQGALVLFPRMVDRWNVVSIIVSKWENYKVLVVTDNSKEFMDIVTSAPDVLWTDLELTPFPLIGYSNLAEINRALQNTEVDIIIFDDVRMLSTISSALNPPSIISNNDFFPKIIALTTWGDTISHLDITTTKFPYLRLLTLDIIKNIRDIDWKMVPVNMSQRQQKYYDQARERELNNMVSEFNLHPLTRMLTLYTYPDSIMADTLIHKSICESDQTTYPDALTSDSWLTPSYIASLDMDGPKLQSIIDGIISNWPDKQLLTTRFNHRYGVDLITSFLHLMVKNKLIPYEYDEIFHTSCTDDYELSINTFHKFNDSSSAILITNIVPFIPLKDISVIHVVDSYSFLNLKMILDRCHKRYLNNSSGDLVIYSYVATYNQSQESYHTEQTSDEVLYDHLLSNIHEADRLYTGLMHTGGPIMFDPKIGLLVQTL